MEALASWSAALTFDAPILVPRIRVIGSKKGTAESRPLFLIELVRAPLNIEVVGCVSIDRTTHGACCGLLPAPFMFAIEQNPGELRSHPDTHGHFARRERLFSLCKALEGLWA
jgi:hypothetical protein